MGYLKYKTTGLNFDENLISTEDVAAVRLDSNVLEIAYTTGILLQLEDSATSMVQDDVNVVIKGINILNGSSGSFLDIKLSQPISSIQTSVST